MLVIIKTASGMANLLLDRTIAHRLVELVGGLHAIPQLLLEGYFQKYYAVWATRSRRVIDLLRLYCH